MKNNEATTETIVKVTYEVGRAFDADDDMAQRDWAAEMARREVRRNNPVAAISVVSVERTRTNKLIVAVAVS